MCLPVPTAVHQFIGGHNGSWESRDQGRPKNKREKLGTQERMRDILSREEWILTVFPNAIVAW